MTEEQKKFRELFPEYTVKNSEVCLSPYIDIFEAGIEIATKELQEENESYEHIIYQNNDTIGKLQEQIEKAKRIIQEFLELNYSEFTKTNAVFLHADKFLKESK